MALKLMNENWDNSYWRFQRIAQFATLDLIEAVTVFKE